MTARPAENWDDDFVFSLPLRSRGTGDAKAGAGPGNERAKDGGRRERRRSSAVRSEWDEPEEGAWDDADDATHGHAREGSPLALATLRRDTPWIADTARTTSMPMTVSNGSTLSSGTLRPSPPAIPRSASQPLSAYTAAAPAPIPTSPKRPAPVQSISQPVLPSAHRQPLRPSPERIPQRKVSLALVIPREVGAGVPVSCGPASARMPPRNDRRYGYGHGPAPPVSAGPMVPSYGPIGSGWDAAATAPPAGTRPKDKGMLARVSSRLTKRFSTAPSYSTASPGASVPASGGPSNTARPRTPVRTQNTPGPPVSHAGRTLRPRARAGPGHSASASVGGQGETRYFAGQGVPMAYSGGAGSGGVEDAYAHAHKLRRVSSQQVHMRGAEGATPVRQRPDRWEGEDDATVATGTAAIATASASTSSRQVSLASATSGTTTASSPLRTPSPYSHVIDHTQTHEPVSQFQSSRAIVPPSHSQISLSSTSSASAYRLPTSGSSTSVGYHLPSPSPASPYHPSRRGWLGGSAAGSEVMVHGGEGDGRAHSRSRIDLALGPPPDGAHDEALGKGHAYDLDQGHNSKESLGTAHSSCYGEEQPYWTPVQRGRSLVDKESMSTMNAPTQPELSRFSMDSAGPTGAQDERDQRTISRSRKPSDEQGQAIRAWEFGSAQEAAQPVATAPASSRSRKISLHRALRRLGTDSSVDTSPGAQSEAAQTAGVARSRSTIKRLGSFSRKHGRKMSDGWRLVSGTGSSSTDQEVRATPPIRQEGYPEPFEALTPRPPHTLLHPPPATADPRSASMPIPTRTSSHHVAGNAVTVRAASGGNDSPTMKGSPGSFRRSSMGDLRIPSRVVSSQKGIKEGIDAVKQFSAGITDLQALVQQRRLLELALIDEAMPDSAAPRGLPPSAPASTIGAQVKTLAQDYAQWWDMADVLIDLADTGNDSAGDPADGDKKGRRVTLAATPSAGQKFPAGTDDPISTGPPTPDAVGRWHATTGRQDLSQKQLKMLKDMLSTRLSPDTIPLRNDSDPPAVPPPSAGKRTSRSAVFFGALKGNNAPPATQNRKAGALKPATPATPKTPRRPSLANLFKRTPSAADLSTPSVRSSHLGNETSRGTVKDSPLSDWDHMDSPDRSQDASTVRTPNNTAPAATPVKPNMPRAHSYTPTEGNQPAMLVLTPDSLPGLLKYLRVVLGRCKEHLREMERIKAEVRSISDGS